MTRGQDATLQLGDTLLLEDAVLEKNNLIEMDTLIQAKRLIEAKSMEFAELPGAQDSQDSLARVPKGAGPQGPKAKGKREGINFVLGQGLKKLN